MDLHITGEVPQLIVDVSERLFSEIVRQEVSYLQFDLNGKAHQDIIDKDNFSSNAGYSIKIPKRLLLKTGSGSVKVVCIRARITRGDGKQVSTHLNALQLEF